MDFSKVYNREKFLNFLRNDFLPDDFVQKEEPIEFASKTVYSRQAIKLGVCKSLDLVVYEIKHSGKDDPRVGLSKEAFRMLSEEWQSHALVLFVPEDNPNNYRFSLIEIKLEGDHKSAKIHRKYSNPRRYSFVLGEEAKVRTPQEYLVKKGNVKDSDDLQKRFSVEVLTKEFYAEVSDWYAWAINNVSFPGEEAEMEGKRIEHRSKNVIRLLTRLLFVWFLKQKHLIPWELFDEDYLSKNVLKDFNPNLKTGLFAEKSQESRYYKAILQNLFFATLNCPIVPQSVEDQRERGFRKSDWYGQGFGQDHLMRYEALFSNPAKFLELVNERVPFLNGGLFDCLDDKQNKTYIDGFSDYLIKPNQLIVPDFLFFGEMQGKGQDLSEFYGDKKKKKSDVNGLIDILKRYNFTIEENTPFDQEVSLDPELLGKVFENLLASYNPETMTTARKQTGSFYTPREIVQYMVDESLVAHLKRTVGEELEEEYRRLMQYTDEEPNLTTEKQKSIIQSLQNCKVLDPACGSGAFPVGVLQQMVHILSQLDPNNEVWKNLILEDSVKEIGTTLRDCTTEERNEIQEDINRNFDDSINRPDYARKLYLIENCIFGVDIQSIAVQISKLRFFISLVVDQNPTQDRNDNFGIRPLPNLEAKFVAANTLIGLHKGERTLFDDSEIDRLQEKLVRASHRIFGAKSNKTKNKHKVRVEELQAQIANRLEDMGVVGNDDARLMRQWRMFDQNASSPFFDPEWMFGISGGFDIVIGNPPYVQLQANGGVLAEQLKNEGYETFARTGDIYCVFYERGIQLLREGGVETLITSNKWMRAGYGEATRRFFVKKTNPLLLIDFAGTKVFESATVDVNILLVSKLSNTKKTKACVIKQNSLEYLSNYIEQNLSVCNFSTSESWVVLSPIEQRIKEKIERIGTPLKDWDINIYRGVLTGYNEAFIISGARKDELIAKDPKSAEIIRPILRGRDIKRYSYEFADLYLIATFPSRKYDIEQYPAVKEHLLSFGFERLEQSGKPGARKKTNNKWFETQDSISYWDDFNKQKVMWKIIGCNINFCFDEKGLICNNAINIMIGNPSVLLQFVGLMNSILFNWYLKLTSEAEVQGGGIQLYVTTLEKTLIKLDFDDDFTKIIQQKSMGRKISDNEIDTKVFDLYNLTKEEILCVLN